jgi:hypothetical protein
MPCARQWTQQMVGLLAGMDAFHTKDQYFLWFSSKENIDSGMLSEIQCGSYIIHYHTEDELHQVLFGQIENQGNQPMLLVVRTSHGGSSGGSNT